MVVDVRLLTGATKIDESGRATKTSWSSAITRSIIWSSTDAVASVDLIVVEAHAALGATRRVRRLTDAQHRSAVAELEALMSDLHIVPVTDELVASAAELADGEALRGYDAVHLAGALIVEATVFSSADAALGAAAVRRGLHIANPLGI